MGRSIARNLGYNLLLQFTTLVLPLITLPYVSRILRADGIGVYNYTLAITQYFVIIGTLGLTMYGSRQIAYTRDDKEIMSRAFWSILSLMIITTGFATVIYLIIFWNAQTYRGIYIIQTINIAAAMIDISWLYMGLEDFKKTVIRNLAVKIIGVCLIFILVKTRNDINIYILINALMTLFGNLVMWMYLPRTVSRVKLKVKDITTHLIPAIQLFIPQVAIEVYVVLDKTMIGALTNVDQVGYFAQSQRIVKVVLGLVTALGIVMLPRMSNIFANGDKEKMDSHLNKSLRGVAFVSVPMAAGIASISNEFVPWFFGPGFESVTYLIKALTPVLFLIAMSNVMGVQYLLPSNKTKEFTISVTLGAVVNVILNLLLIPQMKAFGACIASVVAEFTVTAIQYYYLRKEIDNKAYMKSLIMYTFASTIMFVIVRIIGSLMRTGILTTIVQSTIGFIVYITVLTLSHEEINSTLLKIIFELLRNEGDWALQKK